MHPAGPMQPPPKTTVYTTSAARIWVDDDGILCISLLPDSEHGAKEAQEILNALPPELEYDFVITDLRRVKAIHREAREKYRDRKLYMRDVLAMALLVGSPLSRAIGNFFIGLSRLPMPTRLFTSEESAKQWLRSAGHRP